MAAKIAALERGDKVAATARDTASLRDLADKYGDAVLPLALDVTARQAVFDTVARAHDHFGRLDVVNNAEYGQFGMIEELSEQVIRDGATALANKATAAGVDVTLEVWPYMVHL
jgi:NADP-dependent 3-hydroxy acid dehydrogenase YdfG